MINVVTDEEKDGRKSASLTRGNATRSLNERRSTTIIYNTTTTYAAFHSSRELVFTRSRDPGNHEFTTCQWNAF